MERKFYPTTYKYINGYKSCHTSGHDSGVIIFIKKRLFGFLWWVYVKDRDGNPITYNHSYNAEAFMQGKIRYYDHIKHEYRTDSVPGVRSVRKMTDEDAWEDICDRVEAKCGSRPDIECARRAWEFDGKNYIHLATIYASLWHSIYKQNGKKLWIKEVQ